MTKIYISEQQQMENTEEFFCFLIGFIIIANLFIEIYLYI